MTAASLIIARKDWREFVRDRRLMVMSVLAAVLALAAVVTAAVGVTSHEADRLATEARDQTTWESQGARNPHGAAHFSRWALRPLTAGALLDPGVTPYAGNAVWMEAHNQNPARNRPVEDSAGAIDLGRFSAAWMMQVLMPLLLFAVAAGLVARERERGTLRLMLVGGASASAVVPGKLRVLGRVAALLALPVIVAALAALMIVGGSAAELPRLVLWAIVHAALLLIAAFIGVAVSARAPTASNAVLVLIAVWAFAAILVPRAGASVAQSLNAVPATDAFWAAMSKDREAQPDVFGKDADTFGAAMARRYGVASNEALPVSLGGLQLEEDERLGNIVWDKHYGALARTYEAQRDMLRWTGLLSPLVAVQNISTALAGTDMAHQLAFQQQAEAHRRRIVTQMNMDMITNGAGKDFDYRADASFWKQIPPFAFQPPTLAQSLRAVWFDLAILAAWLIAAVLFAAAAARRLTREAL